MNGVRQGDGIVTVALKLCLGESSKRMKKTVKRRKYIRLDLPWYNNVLHKLTYRCLLKNQTISLSLKEILLDFEQNRINKFQKRKYLEEIITLTAVEGIKRRIQKMKIAI